jgi:glutamate-5-semialdehyde dehydrogenase
LAHASTAQRDGALRRLAKVLVSQSAEILAENAVDIEAAEQAGLSAALIDRLLLNEDRLAGIAADLNRVAELPDPLGETFDEATLPNGLRIHKQRVPIGVLAVIYESRPNVTIDVAGLAIKTGNAAILRGGSESINSNRVLVRCVQKALDDSGLPTESVQFIDDPDRALVTELMRLHSHVDLIIPRGGNALHEYCRENSIIPVITGGIGICHLFVDESADQESALEVIRNAKLQRPTVCNALDTLLAHRAIAADFLPAVVRDLFHDGVAFRADRSAMPYLEEGTESGQLLDAVAEAGPDDFDTEWLSLVLGLKVVDSLEVAIEHIERHGTSHSDGILTQNDDNAQRFVERVDSAAVYVNASTRFTDGAQFGLGAEVAVSTQRLHARGPMGPRELTTYKWVVLGDGHIRDGT